MLKELLKLTFLSILPYKFFYTEGNTNNKGGEKMPPIQYQYINNKLFPTVSRELTRFMGQTNYISKYIPEIAVNSSKGAIGADLDNTAYNLKNMYGGTALGHVFNGVIFNDQMEYQDVQQKFYILIPVDIYIELQSLFRMFKDYITYLSNLPDGKYKALRPDLFNAVTSGITVVGTAFRVADDKELDSEYQIKNLTDIWTGNYIYMFTTSSNIMDLASIKEVVYLQNDMRYFDFLGNNLWRTRTKRQTLASNPLGFARLKLKLTD